MKNKIILILVGVLAAFMIGFGVYTLNQVNYHTCTVTDKDRITNMHEGGSEMRVYTSDCGTFSVADSLIDGVFDSADVYGSIEPDNVYDFKTRGVRVPVLSMFPKIVEVEAVNG